MKNLSFWVWAWFLFFASSSFVIVFCEADSSTNNNTKQDVGIVQVLETEIWEASTDAWKASGGRWTNESGKPSLTPSEVSPPKGFDFEGDWKIVVSAGDSMGWEYQFQYLQPPRRRRIWLRSLKPQKVTPPPKTQRKSKQVQLARPGATGSGATSTLSRTLESIRDDYNFKGFGISVYKSFIFPSSFGLQLRLPLTMNFNMWDRHPELPSVSTSVAFFFPWTIAAFLSTSVHMEWVKWIAKCVLVFIPRLILFCFYQMLLPLLWRTASAVLFPFQRDRMPPIPKAPNHLLVIDKPRYNPELSERIGCSISYRWSKLDGFEGRVSYWHSYLPTLMVYRKLLQRRGQQSLLMENDWWQRHFGTIGLSSGYPIRDPPHFSCSACLSLDGLYWRPSPSSSSGGGGETKSAAIIHSEEEAITPVASIQDIAPANNNKKVQQEEETRQELKPVLSSRRVATSKAESRS
jgi:hypothetical protein